MALGVAENEAGVVVDGADADEARGGGILGSRVPPAVPVAPSVKSGQGCEKAIAKGAFVMDVSVVHERTGSLENLIDISISLGLGLLYPYS